MMYLIFLFVIMVFTMAFSLGEYCNYVMSDPPDEEVMIETAEVGNQSIQTLTFTSHDMIAAEKRDVGPSAAFVNSSSYFEIANNEVFITTCPPVGQSQSLEITLKENRDCVYSFSVTVNPSKAIISAPGNTTVVVGSQADVVDVLEFTIQNEGRCTGFECSATFRNADMKVWIEKGTNIIRISRDDIMFGIVYQLRVSCDTRVSDKELTKSSVADVQIMFIDRLTPPNSTGSPAFLDKAYLSVRLVMTMTAILRWDHYLN